MARSAEVAQPFLAQATERTEGVIYHFFPWLKEASEKRTQVDRLEMAEAWKAKFGDPKDPQVRARIEATAQALYDRARQGQKRGG